MNYDTHNRAASMADEEVMTEQNKAKRQRETESENLRAQKKTTLTTDGKVNMSVLSAIERAASQHTKNTNDGDVQNFAYATFPKTAQDMPQDEFEDLFRQFGPELNDLITRKIATVTKTTVRDNVIGWLSLPEGDRNRKLLLSLAADTSNWPGNIQRLKLNLSKPKDSGFIDPLSLPHIIVLNLRVQFTDQSSGYGNEGRGTNPLDCKHTRYSSHTFPQGQGDRRSGQTDGARGRGRGITISNYEYNTHCSTLTYHLGRGSRGNGQMNGSKQTKTILQIHNDTGTVKMQCQPWVDGPQLKELFIQKIVDSTNGEKGDYPFQLALLHNQKLSSPGYRIIHVVVLPLKEDDDFPSELFTLFENLTIGGQDMMSRTLSGTYQKSPQRICPCTDAGCEPEECPSLASIIGSAFIELHLNLMKKGNDEMVNLWSDKDVKDLKTIAD